MVNSRLWRIHTAPVVGVVVIVVAVGGDGGDVVVVGFPGLISADADNTRAALPFYQHKLSLHSRSHHIPCALVREDKAPRCGSVMLMMRLARPFPFYPPKVLDLPPGPLHQEQLLRGEKPDDRQLSRQEPRAQGL